MYWTRNGDFELNITKRQAAACSHSGQCDTDVLKLSNVPAIRKQLNKIKPAALTNELRDFGAWDNEELSDHGANIQRILWIACGDISGGNLQAGLPLRGTHRSGRLYDFAFPFGGC